MSLTKLNKGDKVTVVVVTPWATTEEIAEVEDCSGNNLYLKGLNAIFNRISGNKMECFPGTKVYIKELKKK